MKATFVTALYNLKITENLGRGDRIGESAYITNDRETIRGLLPSKAHIETIGLLEAAAILNADAVIYSHERNSADVSPEAFLTTKLYLVDSFLSAAWLFADHSINHEMGYYFFPDASGVNATSNLLSTVSTTSRGERVSTAITRTELREIRQFYDKSVQVAYPVHSGPRLQLTKDRNRIDRAFHHIGSARVASDIGFKITSYCSALEALLSSSQNELAHQLAERTAYLLGESLEERVSLYRGVKGAYAVRSKIVHGAAVAADSIAQLVETSAFCDAVTRRLLFGILSSDDYRQLFETGGTKLDSRMLELILGSGERLPAADRGSQT